MEDDAELNRGEDLPTFTWRVTGFPFKKKSFQIKAQPIKMCIRIQSTRIMRQEALSVYHCLENFIMQFIYILCSFLKLPGLKNL